jgi:hypothetical protein
MPPEQRAAQRTLIGLFRTGGGVWLDEQRGLCMWRSPEAAEWGLDATALSKHLDVLEVPYTVSPEVLDVGKRKKAGFTIQVARNDFGAITRWVPSFQKSIDAAEKEWDEDPTGPADA